MFALFALAPATAETFSSGEFHFSVDFPKEPQQGGPFDSESGSDGAPYSTTVVFSAGLVHHYAAAIGIETFRAGETVDAQQTLVSERDGAMQGRILQSSEPMMVHRQPALHFFFTNPTDRSSGEGIAVVASGERIRAYVVLAEHGEDATPAEVVLINRFVRSFRLTD